MADQINDVLTLEQVAQQEAKAAKEGYIHKTLVAFDQFWNVFTGGLPDETISSRAQRDALKGELVAKILTHGLDAIQVDHGQKAEAGDLERATNVAAIETEAVQE